MTINSLQHQRFKSILTRPGDTIRFPWVKSSDPQDCPHPHTFQTPDTHSGYQLYFYRLQDILAIDWRTEIPPPWVWLICWIASQNSEKCLLTIISSLQDMIQDTDKQPDEKEQKVRPQRVPIRGSFCLGGDGDCHSSSKLMWSPTWKLPQHHTFEIPWRLHPASMSNY